jgi:hypothetical protein
MSSNELNFDKNNTMIQQERNCIDKRDGSKQFNINYKSMAHDDKCFIDIDTRQSIGPGNYVVTNLYDCECLIPDIVKNATDNVCVPFKNGNDVASCVIDDSSKLRWGLQKKFPKCPQQLFERPYKTVPYMGKGILMVDQDSELKFAEDSRTKRSNNTLSGVTIPNYFTPLVDYLSKNIQNTTHIIEEEQGWIRSGAPSRLVVRDADYATRCNKAYMNKSTNADFWTGKGSLLTQ